MFIYWQAKCDWAVVLQGRPIKYRVGPGWVTLTISENPGKGELGSGYQNCERPESDILDRDRNNSCHIHLMQVLKRSI